VLQEEVTLHSDTPFSPITNLSRGFSQLLSRETQWKNTGPTHSHAENIRTLERADYVRALAAHASTPEPAIDPLRRLLADVQSGY
jgi:hypothetical protein